MQEHLSDETIAALLDGMLEGKEKDEAQAHLADCDRCRAILGETAAFLADEAEAPTGQVVPFRTKARLIWWGSGLLAALLLIGFSCATTVATSSELCS